MCDICHDTVHGSCEQLLIFVVHGQHDEELGSTRRIEEYLTQGIALILEVVGVTSCGSVTHVSELSRLSVVELVEQLRWDWTVEDQVTVVELHPLERLVSSWDTLRNLAESHTTSLAVLHHGRVKSAWHVVIGISAVRAEQTTSCLTVNIVFVHDVVVSICILVHRPNMVAMLVEVRSRSIGVVAFPW